MAIHCAVKGDAIKRRTAEPWPLYILHRFEQTQFDIKGKFKKKKRKGKMTQYCLARTVSEISSLSYKEVCVCL